MEEKERFENRDGIYDTTIDDYANTDILVNLLNQQDKRISKLKQQLAESESKRKSLEEKFKFLTEEIKECFVDGQKYNELREQKDKEIQELKQQLYDLPKKIVGEIKAYYTIPIYDSPYADTKVGVLLDRLDTILKKYGVENE